MKAMQVNKADQGPVLILVERQKPEASLGEILVHVYAAGVTPTELPGCFRPLNGDSHFSPSLSLLQKSDLPKSAESSSRLSLLSIRVGERGFRSFWTIRATGTIDSRMGYFKFKW
jgi:hypothetical protein